MKFGTTLAVILFSVIFANAAVAHVSERALVLILPTDIYIFFGVSAVAVTVFLTVLVPPSVFGILGGDEPAVPESFLQTKPQTLASLISLFIFFDAKNKCL